MDNKHSLSKEFNPYSESDPTFESAEALLLFATGEAPSEGQTAQMEKLLFMLKNVCGVDVETLADGVVSLRLSGITKLHS
ncbi:hypothetical protein NI389_18700 (plasmid) [Pseudoalteromonas xiamenensis]|uniref:hypothetical protein n=1 Tax=Pseudoalteromonas xiamenensis TaxID=882626 RepID=UPI0027E55B4D|nr:hypothetical protein [Pseudoalteromonas xiamenensis]WMN61837.1 hypothetical protein NI389_18700 [Pseudoalteromonas xiamenensis]